MKNSGSLVCPAIRGIVARRIWRPCDATGRARPTGGASSLCANFVVTHRMRPWIFSLRRTMINRRQVLGRQGEAVAERYLMKKGYKLVERNYRCAAGEVDLIVLDRRVIVFVEVKTRTSVAFGTPAESIHKRKLSRFIAASNIFLAKNKLHGSSVRYDGIELMLEKGKFRLNHIKNITM